MLTIEYASDITRRPNEVFYLPGNDLGQMLPEYGKLELPAWIISNDIYHAPVLSARAECLQFMIDEIQKNRPQAGFWALLRRKAYETWRIARHYGLVKHGGHACNAICANPILHQTERVVNGALHFYGVMRLEYILCAALVDILPRDCALICSPDNNPGTESWITNLVAGGWSSRNTEPAWEILTSAMEHECLILHTFGLLDDDHVTSAMIGSREMLDGFFMDEYGESV